MRTFMAVLFTLMGVLVVLPAAARNGPDDENGDHSNGSASTATGGGPATRDVANARIQPPRNVPAPTPPPVAPTPHPQNSGATVFAVTGQRYGQPTIVAVPSVVVPSTSTPSAPPSGFTPYGGYAQPMLTPLSTPPPVVVSDGPSPTVVVGGGGFTLPVAGAQPVGTLSNPNAP